MFISNRPVNRQRMETSGGKDRTEQPQEVPPPGPRPPPPPPTPKLMHGKQTCGFHKGGGAGGSGKQVAQRQEQEGRRGRMSSAWNEEVFADLARPARPSQLSGKTTQAAHGSGTVPRPHRFVLWGGGGLGARCLFLGRRGLPCLGFQRQRATQRGWELGHALERGATASAGVRSCAPHGGRPGFGVLLQGRHGAVFPGWSEGAENGLFSAGTRACRAPGG